MAYTEDDLLPISGLEHLVYCERQASLIHVEGLWSDNEHTALGSDRHAKVHEPAVEVRGNVRIVRGLRLRSMELGLVGMADVTEFHLQPDSPGQYGSSGYASLPGVAGLWRPYPVEYKKGVMRKEPGYEVQLCAQAICLEEMLGARVTEGAVYFAESGHRWRVSCNADLRKQTRYAARRFHDLVLTGATPPAVYGKKCARCSLVDLCLPKIRRGKSVESYVDAGIKGMFDDEETP